METPEFNFLNDELVDVYKPSEDSFLLIDALEMDLEKFKLNKPITCLEIGTGSGVVISALAMALDKFYFSYFLGVDINPQACRLTKKTSVRNNVDIEVIEMDLLQSMCARNIFDVILFNPPYVVTEPVEIEDKRLISKAWAGGYKGRQVMDRIFPLIPDFLSKNGLFYLLVIKENEPNYIIDKFKDFDIPGSIVIERKIRGEHLYVLRFQKKK